MTLYHNIISNLYLDKNIKNRLKLDEMLIASKALNYPDRKFKTIHVAGTNGKGSVSTKIANVLSLSGYKTALFVSPHVTSYRERISINGKLISKDDFILCYKKIIKLEKDLNIELSFFEKTTLLAFLYFAKQKVDFAIIEVGLGGRLDATNVITPKLSVITSISFDHKEILGFSLEEIAYEKAGIIKSKIPVIIGPEADFNSIREKAKKTNSTIYKVLKIHGSYDDQNSEIAKLAIQVLSDKFAIDKKAILKGVKKRVKCRFEIHEDLRSFPVIFDVSHNEDGLKELKKTLDIFFSKRKIRMILGFSKNKDIFSCTKIIKTFFSPVHIVQAKSDMAMCKQKIKKAFSKSNFLNFSMEEDMKTTLQKAEKLCQENNEILLVCGSFFIMNEVRAYFKIKEERDLIY